MLHHLIFVYLIFLKQINLSLATLDDSVLNLWITHLAYVRKSFKEEMTKLFSCLCSSNCRPRTYDVTSTTVCLSTLVACKLEWQTFKGKLNLPKSNLNENYALKKTMYKLISHTSCMCVRVCKKKNKKMLQEYESKLTDLTVDRACGI